MTPAEANTADAAGQDPADRAAEDRSANEQVLVDSSVWIEYYQPTGRPELQAAVQGALARARVGTTAVVLVEVLRGALTRESLESLEADLSALHWLDVTPDVARRAAEIGFGLDRKGKRVPATDLVIAAAAIEYGYTLWHAGGHFEVIAEDSALRHRRMA
jgi:predicted nucleic acid-binding protein